MRATALAALLALLLAAPAARAQDPYEVFPVQRELVDPPARLFGEAATVGSAERVVALWPELAAVAAELGADNPPPVDIYLLRHERFRALTRHTLPEWGVGYCGWPGGPVVLDVEALSSGRKTLSEVLRHEMSHAWLGQRLGRMQVPRWFVEGVAQAQAGEWRFQDTVSLVAGASTGRLGGLEELSGSFPRTGGAAQHAYRMGLRAVGRLEADLAGQGGWPALVDEAARRGDFDAAFEALLGVPRTQWQRNFHADLQLRYGWLAALASAGSLFTLMSLVFLAAAARAYWRKRRRLEEMEREERGLGVVGGDGPPTASS